MVIIDPSVYEVIVELASPTGERVRPNQEAFVAPETAIAETAVGDTYQETLVAAARARGEVFAVNPAVSPGGRRTVTVLAKNEGNTVGQILAELEPSLQEMQQSWPQGYSYSFGGETEDQAETFGSAGQALALAVFLVFAVLVLQLGSFRQPFIILLAIPFTTIGTFGGFFLVGIRFSFTAFIGIIALVGIVVNDAIVMVDTMNRYQEEGIKKQAAANGVADRLRPVLTTSITTIIGLIPLALSDPTWMPLCSAIIFGLIAATLSALLVVPSLYLLLTPKTEVG